jgi:hypothetical protein
MQLNTVPTGSVGADGYRCRSLRFVIGFAGRRTRALLFFVGGTSTTAEVILILISILTCESPTNTVTAEWDHPSVVLATNIYNPSACLPGHGRPRHGHWHVPRFST